MYTLLLLFGLSAPASPIVADAALSTVSSADTPAPAQSKGDPDYDKRKNEAGNDVAKLWKLYEWCRDSKREKESKTTLKQILKLDPTNKDANVAAGNVFFDGKWFANQKKIDEYKKEKESEEKRAQGLVEWKGQWVQPGDVPFLEKGLVRDDSGKWVNPEDAKKLAEGCVKQDLTWIPAAEKENVQKNLWKCGDQWLAIAEANQYHSEPNQWWTIPSDHYHLYTTCDRDVAIQKIKRQLDYAYGDLARVYGMAPDAPPIVIVLRDQPQYSSFAADVDSQGLSSVHFAFFADGAKDPNTDEFLHAGAGFWDASTDAGNKWGVHSVRHALGQSFGEALDPSPAIIEKRKKAKMSDKQFWDGFYEEKRIPRWFRFGAASYAERYFNDPTVDKGNDPWWTRKWSVGNISTRGGLRPLKQIFEFDLKGGGPDAEKLLSEAGLVVAYILDGNNAKVAPKFKEFQEGIKSGKDKKALAAISAALEAEVTKNEADLKKFAGL